MQWLGPGPPGQGLPSASPPGSGSPFTQIPPFRLAEIANVFLGLGTGVGVIVGGLIAGTSHMAVAWRLVVIAGTVILLVSIGEAVRRMVVRPRQRYVRSLVKSFSTEIAYQTNLVRGAIRDGAYWNPEERQLPTAVWQRYPELAADERLAPAFHATVTAYQHADRLNWVARRRWDQQRNVVASGSQDGIDEALTAFSTAYNALLRAVGTEP